MKIHITLKHILHKKYGNIDGVDITIDVSLLIQGRCQGRIYVALSTYCILQVPNKNKCSIFKTPS